MTNAIQQHHLSKLDIFTPNRLHPTVPPLAHGEYPVMGGVATSAYLQSHHWYNITDSLVLYEPDLISRRSQIHSQLDHTNRIDTQLRKRVRRHDTLMLHMGIAYDTAHKRWYKRWREEGSTKLARASMETRESRDEYVKRGLAYERTVMGMKGCSEESAIELE